MADADANPTGNQSIRIAAIFIVLFTGGCGSLAPALCAKFFPTLPKHVSFKLMKGYAAGVVLATGVVHMLTDGISALQSAWPSQDFPVGAVIVLGAILTTLFIEQSAAMYFAWEAKSNPPPAQRQAEMRSYEATIVQPQGISLQTIEPVLAEGSSSPTPSLTTEQRQHAKSGDHGHSHGHHLLELMKDHGIAQRKVIIAHVLELGIAFHSVIIGITLGVTTQTGPLNALLAAICFHQFFEGFALGSAILEADMKNKFYIYVMAIIFAVTTPSGIAIGVGISTTYNANSLSAEITEGVFDSISGGILIYMGLVDLISEEFRALGDRPDLRIYMLLAVCFGSGCMALLAIWA